MLILYFIFIIYIYSVDYDLIEKDFDNNSIENIYSFAESEGSVYFNLIDKIYKYNNGNLNEIDIFGYEKYF